MVFTLWTLLWQLLRRLGLLWYFQLLLQFSNCEKSKFVGRLFRFFRRLFFWRIIRRLRRLRQLQRFAHRRNERAFVFDGIAVGTSRSAVGRPPNHPSQGPQLSPRHA